MNATQKSVSELRLISSAYAATIEAHNAELACIVERTKDIGCKNEALLKDLSHMKAESARLDNEIYMIQAHTKSIEEQIALFDGFIRPQLRNDLKLKQEFCITKEKEYKAMLDHHEELWKKYEVVYNRFPRVSERNELRNSLQLKKIEVMRKRQEVIEKAQQAKQMQEIKASRLEILRADFLDWVNKEQEARKKYEDLLKENNEIRERIDEEERKKEEQQQSEKLREQLRCHDLQSAEAESSSRAKPAASRSFIINIPKLNLPSFISLDILTPSTYSQPVKSCIQPSTSPKAPAPVVLSRRPSNQQVPPASSVLVPAVVPFSLSVVSPQNCKSYERSSNVLGQSVCEDQERRITSNKNESQKTALPKLGEIARIFPESHDVTPNLPLTETITSHSGNSKRESILSTENIAAKMKEIIRTTPKISQNTQKSPVKVPKQVIQGGKNDSVDQEPDIFSQSEAQENYCRLVAENTVENSSIHQTEQSADPANCIHSESDFNSGHSLESALSGDAYDFTPEYADDMYGSLQSPPAFETPMSPMGAAFDTSPAHSISEDNMKDSKGDGNKMPGFSAFNFFSQTSTNIFGRESSSQNDQSEREKSTSSFSFLF